MLLDDEMLISTPNGEEKLMKILFTYESEQRHKQYVFLYDEKNEDEILVYSYNEKDLSLEEIKDEEEYKEAEEVLNAFFEDEKIQEIKRK